MNSQDIEIPENMAEFFNVRAEGYDKYIQGSIFSEPTFIQFYQSISLPIEKTNEPLNILDLGCGTGLEIDFLLQRVPDAHISGVDVSSNMLDLLQKRYTSYTDHLTLIKDSYLTMPFGTQTYDHIISAMSLHHLLHETKLNFYKKIHSALKPGGKYIEGDSVTTTDGESQFLGEYHESLELMPKKEDGYYHIDLPFSIDTQKTLLLEAGFRDFNLLWQMDSSAIWNIAVYAVTK